MRRPARWRGPAGPAGSGGVTPSPPPQRSPRFAATTTRIGIVCARRRKRRAAMRRRHNRGFGRRRHRGRRPCLRGGARRRHGRRRARRLQRGRRARPEGSAKGAARHQLRNLLRPTASTCTPIPSPENRKPVTWRHISPWMIKATVDIEDHRFYDHGGVDYQGMFRALLDDFEGRPRGAGRLDDRAAGGAKPLPRRQRPVG